MLLFRDADDDAISRVSNGSSSSVKGAEEISKSDAENFDRGCLRRVVKRVSLPTVVKLLNHCLVGIAL